MWGFLGLNYPPLSLSAHARSILLACWQHCNMPSLEENISNRPAPVALMSIRWTHSALSNPGISNHLCFLPFVWPGSTLHSARTMVFWLIPLITLEAGRCTSAAFIPIINTRCVSELFIKSHSVEQQLSVRHPEMRSTVKHEGVCVYRDMHMYEDMFI